MSSLERKVCLKLVIEYPQVPGDRIVASTALIVEITAVRIVVRMARSTFGFGAAEYLRGMAFRAFRFAMNAKQWKRAQIVIEKQGILPVHLCVTALALGTERLFVHVVVEVAGIAGRT